jgi:hypothetical protein
VSENGALRRIFGPKREEVARGWRRLHKEEVHNVYCPPNINSRRKKWTGHVARVGEVRNAYVILVGKAEEKRPLGKSRRGWEDDIIMDLGKKRSGSVDWIHRAQNRNQWRTQ